MRDALTNTDFLRDTGTPKLMRDVIAFIQSADETIYSGTRVPLLFLGILARTIELAQEQGKDPAKAAAAMVKRTIGATDGG